MSKWITQVSQCITEVTADNNKKVEEKNVSMFYSRTLFKQACRRLLWWA